MKTFHFLLLASFSFLIFSCGDDDESNDPFVAVAIYDTAYSVGSVVTLDASQSQGIDGASVQWIYNSAPMEENDINSDTSFSRVAPITSFVAKRNGNYSFNLRLTKNGRFTETPIFFTVSGILELTDLSQLDNRTFENLGNGPDVGDYLINTVLEIPDDGEEYRIHEGTTIKFGENGGLKIEGRLVNAQLGSGLVYFNALNNNWKGIYLNNTFDVQQASIEGGGSSSYTNDPNDAANIYVDNGGRINSSYLEIKESAGFGIVSSRDKTGNIFNGNSPSIQFENNVNTARVSTANLINYNFVISDKTNARFEVFHQGNANLSGIIYDIVALDSLIFSSIGFIENANIKFVAGSYVKALSDLSIRSSTLTADDPNPAAKWRGVVYTGGGSIIDNTEISGAGSGLLPGATQAAAVYIRQNGQLGNITNSTIKDNNGYGIYSEGLINAIYGNTFSNNTIAHLKMSVGTADAFRVPANTFDGNITAVELFNPNPGSNPPGLTVDESWAALGGGNFYLCDSDIEFSRWTLLPGAEVQMTIDKYIKVQSKFTAEGTATEPIVITSRLGNRGDWQGIQLMSGAQATLEYLQIKNAGRNSGIQTFGSQHGGGLVVQSNPNLPVSVTNCEITNAGEYGVVIQAGAGDFAIDSTASNNTLEGALGGYFDEN